MNFSYYNKNTSNINFKNELYSFHPNIILADTVKYQSMGACNILNYTDLDDFKEDFIVTIATRRWGKDGEHDNSMNSLAEQYKLFEKFNKSKRKSRDELIFMGKFKKSINSIKNYLRIEDENYLTEYNILEVIPFYKEDVLKLKLQDFYEGREIQEVYIREIANEMIAYENLLSFDMSVEEHFKYSISGDDENKGFDFIKIPLWRFPVFKGITYPQIKHIREDLKPKLLPFKKTLKELKDALYRLSFSENNMQQIKQLCKDKMYHNIAHVQESINDSLYISQQRNKFNSEQGADFCLGIASAETLLDYFEKTEIVLPYVANEIKQQLAKHIALNTTYIFTYYKIFIDEQSSYI